MEYAKLALDFATKAHKGQKDKGGMPYLVHPCYVADHVDGDVAKAVAYLHDVIEDTWATTGDLKNAGFSDEIIEAVKLLTRDKDMDYEKYIENLCKNPVAKTVKLADLEHNSQIDRIKNPTEKDYKRQAKYLKMIDKIKKAGNNHRIIPA